MDHARSRFGCFFFAFALAAALAREDAALAQAVEAPRQVTPPRLTTDSPAVYPAEALREHRAGPVPVTLVLVVGPDGSVTDATVADSQGPAFDEAALRAASGLHFEPARRDGLPVASKIQFRYVFTPPPAKLRGRVSARAGDRPIADCTVRVTDSSGAERSVSTRADGAWEVSALPPGRVHLRFAAPGWTEVDADEEVAAGEETDVVQRLDLVPAPSEPSAEEVVVRGTRPPREVTRRTLSRDELDHTPGTQGDAIQALQNLPGVARPPPLTGLLIVRGTAPEDTGVYVDGTPIPILYHFGGLYSVIPTESLDKVDFYPGVFSAQYGRAMGGIVDIGLRSPRSDGLHGFAQLNLTDVRLLGEGPIFDTGVSVLAAARASNPIITAIASTARGVTVAPRFVDYQAVLERKLSGRSSVRLAVFGSDDAVQVVNSTPDASDPSYGGTLYNHTRFWRIQGRYEESVGDRTTLNATAAFGSDAVSVGLGTNQLVTTTYPLSLRAEVAERLVQGVRLNIGADVLYEPYDLRLSLPLMTSPLAPSSGAAQLRVQSRQSGSVFLPGAYAEFELTPWSPLRVVPSVRVDYDSATKAWDVAPRINARLDLTPRFPRTTLKAGAGAYDQPPQLIETAPVYGQSGLHSNKSLHFDVGLEQELTRDIDLSVDAFYTPFKDQVVAGLGNSGSGFAYGVEWFLRYKPDAHFFGWLSYTISRSERRSAPGQPLYLFDFDQTHVFTLLGSYILGRGWQVGGRLRFITGNPYTPTSEGAYDATSGSQLGVAAFPPNAARLPTFWALDLRVDKTWAFRHWKLSMFLDIQNVTNTSNVESVAYNYNFTQTTQVSGLPILPILGVRAEF